MRNIPDYVPSIALLLCVISGFLAVILGEVHQGAGVALAVISIVTFFVGFGIMFSIRRKGVK